MLRATTTRVVTPRLSARVVAIRNASASSTESVPEKKTRFKIKIGKSRPPIYHQFDCKTELSDGSVVLRRTQIPKDEIRMITDQRNNPLWNPSRKDLDVADANANSRMTKFKSKFSFFDIDSSGEGKANKGENKVAKSKGQSKESKEAQAKNKETTSDDVQEIKEVVDEPLALDDYLDILGRNVQEVNSGGKLASKKKKSKK